MTVLAAVCAGLPETGTSAPVPYKLDDHTLHLWHLDEPTAPAENAVPGAKPLLSLHNGAAMGVPGPPGFGTCLKTSADAVPPADIAAFRGGILLAAENLAYDLSDNVTPPFPYFGNDGAFTMEALVKLDVMPESMPTHAAMILSMDDDDSHGRRIFHFRIEESGHLNFSPLPGSGTSGGAYTRLPTEGVHQVEVDTWFHVAVAYDGNAGSTDNLRLYWTRLDSTVTEANQIGSGTLTADFNGDLGDFAIGNEARQFRGNAESEPFAGCIDEVRISSIARSATDFLFSNQTVKSETVENALPPPSSEVSIRLDSIKINGNPWNLADVRDNILLLPPGQHRIDIGFRHLSGPASGPVKVTYQLVGADDGWRVSTRGMQVICQFLDDALQVVSQAAFPVSGTSPGWEGSISESKLLPRRESLMVPMGARHLRVRISSGTPDTTGTLILDDFQVTSTIHGASRTPVNIWRNTEVSGTSEPSLPDETPGGWKKGLGDPSICRITITSDGPMIALIDGDSDRYGEWVATNPLPPEIAEGRTLVVSWREVFNIIAGQQHLAAYLKVSPGEYTFQTSAIALSGMPTGSSTSLRIRIPQSLVQRPWFSPVLVGGLIALVSSIILMVIRQHSRSKVERHRLQTELEKDRTRIARDMHDDLGTVATAITMTASLAQRKLTSDPSKAAEHLHTVGRSARKLVGALDDLVWAVDPSNDTLDEIGVHLTRLVEDLFTDSGIRHRIRIPGILPHAHLGSETRHHLALAVKEALHNVLQHSSASEVILSMVVLSDGIRIEVRDDGTGIAQSGGKGNGLTNMTKRLADISGICQIESIPPHGTLVRMQLPLAF